MNLAFPAVVLLSLLLPGYLFSYAYARGTWGWSSPTSFRSILEDTVTAVVVAPLLHALWCAAAISCLGVRVDLELVVGLLGNTDASIKRAAVMIAAQPIRILSYFLTLYCGSWLAGQALHKAVRANSLDRTFRSFRFSNYWYYLLSGELLQFPEYDAPARPVEGVVLTAIVEAGGIAFLYRGLIQDFTYSRSGDLESILISSAHRRKLTDDRVSAQMGVSGQLHGDQRYYRIQGDYLVLRFSEIKTLNVDYIWLGSDAEISSPKHDVQLTLDL